MISLSFMNFAIYFAPSIIPSLIGRIIFFTKSTSSFFPFLIAFPFSYPATLLVSELNIISYIVSVSATYSHVTLVSRISARFDTFSLCGL